MFKRLAATALFVLFGNALAWAQMPTPADSVIKGVYDDIARYESQFNSNPSAATAKRLQRLMKITEGRLQGSQNQSDPSFKAAADALAALNEQFAAAIEGRPAQQAAPAGQQPAPAATTATSSDPVVQAAAQELARISAAIDAMQPGDKATGQKYISELEAVGSRLRGVAQKDEAWAAAARQYNALQKRVVEVANAPAPAGSQQAQQPAAADKPDPNIERALRDLKFAERNVDNLRPDDVRQEQQILAELKRLGDVIGGVQNRSHPSWQEALEYRASLYLKLARKRLAAIDKGLTDIEQAVRNSPSVEFLNPDVLNKVTNAVASYSKQLDVYGFYKEKPQMLEDTPGLLEVFDRPDRILALMDQRTAEAKAEEGALGDVVAEVDAIEARMKAIEVPRTLNGQDITLALTEQYVASMKKVQESMGRDAAYLQQIKGRTDKVDKQRLDRLAHWIGSDMARKTDESLTQTKAIFEAGWRDHQRVLDFHAADDPHDADHQSNRFLGEGRYDETLAKFDKMADWVRAAQAFEAAYGPDRQAERDQQLAAIATAVEEYKADYKTAVGAVRLAKGVDDDKLRDIAREVLTSGRYEKIGKILRIETSKMTHRKETRGSISGTVTGASVTANLYEWDEFQARTIEKVGDRHFIYVNDIKYFYSGGTNTPLERWLLAGRFVSNPILEENIHK